MRDSNAVTRSPQRSSEMNIRNTRTRVAAHVTDPGGTILLEMRARSFVVLRAPDTFRIDCLRGGVWITQETRRDDLLLARGDHCRLQGTQRVFLNSFNGVLLALSHVGRRPAGATAKSLDFRLEVTQGAYALRGGCPTPRDAVSGGDRRRNGLPAASMDRE